MSVGSEFAGWSALVTGGASGIGLESARELHRRGARVAVIDLKVDEVPAEFAAFAVDVKHRTEVEQAVTEIAQVQGGLDVVVNCAGIASRGPFESISDEEWSEVFDVNVIGMVRVIRAGVHHLSRSDRAAVVNLASVSANIGLAGISAYTASKGAIRALTRALAVELLPQGIRVNCISPGTVDTPWIRAYIDSLDDPSGAELAAHSRQPTGRMVTAQEVADAVCYLAGPSARSMTGADLALDGGMSSIRPE